ncbi:MAG TPA: bifunctional aspartate kinase/homoserine dehydrogenase I [Gammaproteobacteria bacterium]|nr:bifunctional aspartate kinase/homoserine dehydrogenase I [Gammaproteobacteria bacterium]
MNEISNPIEVHKFGGSSLATAAHFRAVQNIVRGNRTAIVVSASAGITNQLQALLNLACQQQAYHEKLADIKQFQHDIIQHLLDADPQCQEMVSIINSDCDAIANLLRTTQLLGSYNTQVQDKVLGYGELWSAQILAALLNREAATLFIDASKILITYRKHKQQYIDWEHSQQLLDPLLQSADFQHLVITGFIATNAEHQFVTLGRNGSDYSAAIFARLLHAEKLIIWTDVDGIYSADPNKVRSAFPLPELSYEEALELAYFGAKVIHPQTIFPAINNNIPIYVKHSGNPLAPGTKISAKCQTTDYLVKGLSCIDDVALINIEGSGMVGVSGTATRVFQVLYQGGISVILISQASSEHSICFAVKQDQANQAQEFLQEQFQFEIGQQLIKGITIDKNCSVLAVVGDGMVGHQGVAGKLFNTLTKANVNIKAVAQGSSERNISVVVERLDIYKALRAVHSGFYLSSKTLSIGLIGPGQVGATLLQQIADTAPQLQHKRKVNLQVRGIIDSKKMLLADSNIDLKQWQSQRDSVATTANMEDFINHIAADDMPHAVIIDCTASAKIADLYPHFIARGLHIITPNKRANSGNFSFYQELHAFAQQKNRFYLYETTVCAGLPVIKTLQDIVATGDEVLSIQGVVSGTLSYIFSQLGMGQKFSSIVREAKRQGYTEPDPRDDLSGMDVARKFVCLARELGHNSTLESLSITSLVPAPLQQVSAEEFLERLPEFDEQIHASLEPMLARGEKPHYVGTIDANGSIHIAIAGFGQNHPFSRLQGTDNMLIFTTRRYQPQSLVIQGPGAGTEVTAAGIFADLLRLVTALD